MYVKKEKKNSEAENSCNEAESKQLTKKEKKALNKKSTQKSEVDTKKKKQ